MIKAGDNKWLCNPWLKQGERKSYRKPILKPGKEKEYELEKIINRLAPLRGSLFRN
jgi:hypothetical protein